MTQTKQKTKKRKVHSPFIDNIFGAALADIESISKLNKENYFLSCAIDILKKGNTNAFQNVLNEAIRKPSKIWIDKGRKFYNRSMKSWLEKNEMKMYLTHNEGKSVVVEDLLEP